MDPPEPVVLRRRTLTNSAAEFVETRSGTEVLHRLEDLPEDLNALQDSPEFVNELDGFTPKGQVFDHNKYYEESRKSRETFRRTLTAFAAEVKQINDDSKLKMDIKDPSEFTLEYSLGIVNEITESRDNAAKTRSCKNFIRGCYRKVEDHRSGVERFLNVIPSDIYGSVISRGFVVILAAVDRHAKQREEIQNFLAKIPEKIETIQRLSEIHHASIQLHSCADAVIVAIFTVLERIMDRIVKTWKRKLTKKYHKATRNILSKLTQKPNEGNGVAITNGPDDDEDQESKLTVTDALSELQDRVDRFQKGVDICREERLGRIETYVVKQGCEYTRTMRECLKRFETHFAMNEARSRQMLRTEFQNAFYRLCTSNPNFNASTGEIDHEQLKLAEKNKAAMLSRSHQESNNQIASKWLKGLRGLTYNTEVDIKDCLKHKWLLDSDEKDISQWILRSQNLREWLHEDESSIIEIDVQTPPTALNNPLSFTSALFASTIQSTDQFPVLAFFCFHRNKQYPIEEEKSGAVALVNSLNGQLLRFMATKRPSVDLSVLEGQNFFSKAKKDLKCGLKLFSKLLSSLPDDDMVFIIIDSLSRLSGHTNEEKVVKRLIRTMKEKEDVLIKVMVTNAFPGSYVKSVADMSLYVPDWVNGFGGIDDSEMKKEIARDSNCRRSLKDGNGKTRLESEDEEEDDDSEEEDDDSEEEDDDSEEDDDDSEEDDSEEDSDEDSED
ncbi:hypothetical protein P280DRAFT_536075 [Massarina eburnea CBS 473.64]|uniref:Nephrocystin 3-like N-terminal domain-containing protein n=1 Tax=Massarina eburnea CBS 473.64 TaxID=1395130 RepID=A0A6A6RJF1_9PLEO|nr:hypothetical protein P280DRAFT_536075 [Massarina eburnea CBS 473.64]